MWSSKIMLFVMFNALFRVWVEFFMRKISLFEEDVFLEFFGIIYMHFISWKVILNCVPVENFKFFKKFLVYMFSIDQICLSTDQKMWMLRPKPTTTFDSCSIPFNQSKLVFKIFWSLLDSSRSIKFPVCFWNKRNQINSFQTLSSSSQFLYTQFLFLFLFFFESKLQVFFPSTTVKTFLPFIFY